MSTAAPTAQPTTATPTSMPTGCPQYPLGYNEAVITSVIVSFFGLWALLMLVSLVYYAFTGDFFYPTIGWGNTQSFYRLIGSDPNAPKSEGGWCPQIF